FEEDLRAGVRGGAERMEAGSLERAGAKGAQTQYPWRGPGQAGAGDRSWQETFPTSGKGPGGELLRSRPGWVLDRPLLDAVGDQKSGGGLVEHRSESEEAAGQECSIGCAEATDDVDPLRIRGAQGLECGASSFAG